VTPAEILWYKIQRRAGDLSSDLRPLILKAYQRITLSYSEAEIARYIETAQIERILDQALNDARLDAAFSPVRERIRRGITDTATHFIRYDIPRTRGQVSFAFDTLSPNVIEGITQLESKVIQTLKEDVREVTRAHVENGLRDGVNPRAVAKSLRDIIPLAPNQLQAVENFRKSLEEGDVSKALGYKLRDKRLKVTDSMTPEQIDKAVDAYRKKMIAFNAETNARTAALDAQKLAQKLSWEEAIEKGLVDRNRLKKKWVGVMDDREREEHRAMEGDTVPFDLPFKNGEQVPGESTYNCRCVSQYFVGR
jgi:hypothetical protein